MVFITSFLSGQRKILNVKSDLTINNVSTEDCHSIIPIKYEDVLNTIYQSQGFIEDVFLCCEGKPVQSTDEFYGDVNIVATLKLRGGKGGFGSMLRAIGAQIEKTTNREACRDLSGRRLRDINEEKRLQDYLATKVEKEKEMLERKRKKLKKMDEDSKHIFEDAKYFEQREKREKDVYESLDKVFASSVPESSGTSSTKLKETENVTQNNAKRKRFLDDLDESSSEEDSEDEDVVAAKTSEDDENLRDGSQKSQISEDLNPGCSKS